MNGSFGVSVLSSSATASRGVAINAARAPPTKVLRCELTDSCAGMTGPVKATLLVIGAVLLHRKFHLPVVQRVYSGYLFPPSHFFLMKIQDAQYEAACAATPVAATPTKRGRRRMSAARPSKDGQRSGS